MVFAPLTRFFKGAYRRPLWSRFARPFTPLGYFFSGDGCFRNMVFGCTCRLFLLHPSRATSQTTVQAGMPMAVDGDNGSLRSSRSERAVFFMACCELCFIVTVS
jgi:hypothetical protein